MTFLFGVVSVSGTRGRMPSIINYMCVYIYIQRDSGLWGDGVKGRP